MKTSSLFSLDLQDLGKGLIVAIGGAVITALQNAIQAGSFTFNWSAIAGIALTAGLSYLGKNFFTPSKRIISAE